MKNLTPGGKASTVSVRKSMMDQLQSSPVREHVGQRFGNYLLYKLLGNGGFARIYLGRHAYLGTWAAVKILSRRHPGKWLTAEHLEGDEEENRVYEGQDRFLYEARIAARLIHPHITRVLEFGMQGNIPFLVMDFAPYGTLRQRHPAGQPLPLPAIMAYTWQITEALQYIHECGLIHRDIKPENVLVGRQKQLWLSDFGIATALQQGRERNGENFGTVAYMAPELIHGEPCFASDQYALALMIYEWLCGAAPFTGSTHEIIQQQLVTPPPSLRSRVRALSGEVDGVVLRALAKDPRRRFGSVYEFAVELEKAYAGTKDSLRGWESVRRQTEELAGEVKIDRATSSSGQHAGSAQRGEGDEPCRAPLPGQNIREASDTFESKKETPISRPRRRKHVFHPSSHYQFGVKMEEKVIYTPHSGDGVEAGQERGKRAVEPHNRQTDAVKLLSGTLQASEPSMLAVPGRRPLKEMQRMGVAAVAGVRRRRPDVWEGMAETFVMGLAIGLLLFSLLIVVLRLHF